MTTLPGSRRSMAAFLYAVPIAILGGLIGLGGAEFRLPILAGTLGYRARQAVPLNLLVSLVTVCVSLLGRARTLLLAPLPDYQWAILTLAASAAVAAFAGTAFVHRLSDARMERIILVLLVVIGSALIVEGFLPGQLPALLPSSPAWHIGAGLLFGAAIGLVSSLLGVAGGELIIPTLVLAYGMDIKIAGIGSLLISLPTVGIGVLRYARLGAYSERRDWSETILPMGAGSVIGALAGSLLVGLAPEGLLKIGLGIILNFSAVRAFRGSTQEHGRRA